MSELSTTTRATLQDRLVVLLGFDDGAADVLDHLLSIEPRKDLLDYLSQLLGNESDEIRQFVNDVERYRRGEALSEQSSATDEKLPDIIEQEQKKLPEYIVEGKPKTKTAARTKPTKNSKGKATEKKEARGTKMKPSAKVEARVQPQKKSPATETGDAQEQVLTSHAEKEPEKSIPQPPPPAPAKKEKPAPQKPPPRGKATVVCGCFGTYHKSLTNCLYCGRISCEREGYSFCPFCGYLVEEVKASKGENGTMDKAVAHKERLLKFDREFARRTVILDDQADYYSHESTGATWLTQEEQAEAEQKEKERQKELHDRKKQVLDIVFSK